MVVLEEIKQAKDLTLRQSAKLAQEINKLVLVILPIEFIIIKVCEYFGISESQFYDVTRKREIVKCRQVAMYLARRHTKFNLKYIGAICGKDHATTLYGIKQVKNLMQTDKDYKKDVEAIINNLI